MSRDPLRRSLDELALDAASPGDRAYMASMLRRIGGSDVAIPAAEPEAPEGPRVIELEFRRGKGHDGTFSPRGATPARAPVTFQENHDPWAVDETIDVIHAPGAGSDPLSAAESFGWLAQSEKVGFSVRKR